MSRFDVILPCYKYAHYLRQCVESVLSQSHGDLRVLIIDDASPDNTEEVARELATQDRRIAYRRHESNCGHIATYNEGLNWADGDYLMILSADDLLTEGSIQRAVELLDANPEVGMVHGKMLVFFDEKEIPHPQIELHHWEFSITDGLEHIQNTCKAAYNLVATPTVMTRTSLQKHVGDFRAELPHTADMEMWLRLALHAPVAYIDAYQAYYRKHTTNMHHLYNDLRGFGISGT